MKGGGAWERDRYDITSAGTTFFTASETRGGWTLGVGGEYAADLRRLDQDVVFGRISVALRRFRGGKAFVRCRDQEKGQNAECECTKAFDGCSWERS